MTEILKDGFRLAKWSSGELLIVESKRLSECVVYCNENRIPWLIISPYHGYTLSDIDFLRECRHVTRIHIQECSADLSGLYSLPLLSWLSVIFQHKLDFSRMPSLTDLSTDWNLRIDDGLLASKGLARLWLRGYKPKGQNLQRIEALTILDDLHIVLSPISTTLGLENVPRIRRLGLSYCRNLTDIKSLKELPVLEELELDHCKRIADLTFLRELKHMRKVIMSDCGSISSLGFIKQLRHLEFFSFVQTTVLDGDMTPLFGLRYAGFRNNRSYSHTREHVKQVIETRTGGNSLYPKPAS